MKTGESRMAGRQVLVVEDDYFVAHSLVCALESYAVDVVGPVATIAEALKLIASGCRIDGAVLDVNLKGETVYPVADALRSHGVPYVFTTGYDRSSVRRGSDDAVCFEKPVSVAEVLEALFG